MNQDEYIKTRVEDQIAWYNRKSVRNKRAYRTLRVLSALVALSIPVLSGLLNEGNAAGLKVTLSIAGAFVALCEALLALYKFRDNWTQYRNAAEGLMQHKFLFTTGAPPYGSADSFAQFVQNAESIMAGERVQWLKRNTMPEEASGKAAAQEGKSDNDAPQEPGPASDPKTDAEAQTPATAPAA